MWLQLCFAQSTEHNWYFGFGAGLNFSSGNPVTLLDNVMTTDEGTATISDSSGSLLFYTNGVTVYDALHQAMPNGTGLAGGVSATQSALIVPDPASGSGYYLFTVAEQLAPFGGYTGLSYSYIEMTANNGLGDVVQKNIALVDSTTEKLSATWHADGKSIWVVAHKWNSNAFYAYKVTCNGIQAPVISNSGSLHQADPSGSTFSAIGCMKISMQSDKLAVAWTYIHTITGGNAYGYANIEIFDFDNSTGIISNPYLIQYGSSGNEYPSTYGVAFSPSGQFLYNTLHRSLPCCARIVDQYDLTASDILNSRITIGVNSGTEAYGTIQAGPDGKLYLAKTNGSTFLAVINQPDQPGIACDFVNNGASLGSKPSTWGLPNNWATLIDVPEYEIFEFEDTTLCSTWELILDATYPFTTVNVSYLWNTGETSPAINPDTSGIYIVNLFLECDTLTDSVNVIINPAPVFELGEDIFQCEDEVLILSGPECINCTYQWNTGDTVRNIDVEEKGVYVLNVINNSGCEFTDSVMADLVKCECNFYLPSAFTPNNDGKNDFFNPLYYCDIAEFKINIFNRWGEKIYTANNPEFKWNGKVENKFVQEGVYAYVIEYVPRLKNIPSNKITKSGTIAVIY